MSRPASEVTAPEAPAHLEPASLTLDELTRESGLSEDQLFQLEGFGLLCPSMVGGVAYYDADGLEVARAAASLARFGIEPRHLRVYKNAADRETAFVEQIVLPMFRQRNPEARAKGRRTAMELVALGERLRGALVRTGLRDLLGP